MDGLHAVYQAVRRRLTQCATLTAMVASSSITVTQRRPKSTYPCIRLRAVGGTGHGASTFFAGDLYINIYTGASAHPSGELASIYNVLSDRIKMKVSGLTTSNYGFSISDEMSVEYPLYSDPDDHFYLTARYSFVGTKRV